MSALQTRTRRRDTIPKGGDRLVDDEIEDAFGGDGPSDPDPTQPDNSKFGQLPGLKALYDAAKKGYFYSFGRAIHGAFKAGPNGTLPGLEGEVSQEMLLRAPNQRRGYRVPWVYPRRPGERRALTLSAGAGSVTPQLQSPVDVLRSKMVCQRLGANVTNFTGEGPQGFIQIPFRSAGSTASWVAENAAPSSSSNATTQGWVMKPNTVTAYSDITRRMLTLGQEGFEAYSLAEVMRSIAVEVDRATLNGSGQNSQPLGILQDFLPSVTPAAGLGGSIAIADLYEIEATLGQNNGDAPADSRLGWVTSPAGRKALRKVDLGGATDTGHPAWWPKTYIVDNKPVIIEELIGWPALSTCSVPANLNASNYTTLALGNWNDVIINLWDGFDFNAMPATVVNPFLQSVSGVVRVSCFVDADVLLVRPGSFCLCAGWAAPY